MNTTHNPVSADAAIRQIADPADLEPFGDALIRYQTKDMSREEWLAIRDYIGASAAGAICGLGRWGSPVQVWAALTGQSEQTTSHPATIGTKLEAKVRRLAAKVLGKTIRQAHYVLQHAKIGPAFCCNLDGYITESKQGPIIPVELKCATRCDTATFVDDPALEWEALAQSLAHPQADWLVEGCAIESYWCQVQAQMSITGAPHAYLFGVLGAFPLLKLSVIGIDAMTPSDYRLIRVPRDQGFIQKMEATIYKFWTRYIQGDERPAELAQAKDLKAVKMRLRRTTGATVPATKKPELDHVVAAFVKLKATQKDIGEKVDAFETKLRIEIGDAAFIDTGSHTVSSKETKRGSRPIRIKAKNGGTS